MQLNMSEIFAHSYINDFELDQILQENPSLYFRKMWGYLDMGKSLIKTPFAFTKLLRYNNITKPEYGSTRTVMDGTTNEWATELIGFDTAAVLQVFEDNTTAAMPLFQYIPMTGVVVFAETPDEGSVFTIDTYSDGYIELPEGFEYIDDLTFLLRIAMLCAWDGRFGSSSLDRVLKPSDRTVTIASEANWLRENTAKAQDSRAWLDSECLKLAQMMTVSR